MRDTASLNTSDRVEQILQESSDDVIMKGCCGGVLKRLDWLKVMSYPNAANKASYINAQPASLYTVALLGLHSSDSTVASYFYQ